MRKVLCLLLSCFFIISAAKADTITIDTSTATEDEIILAIDILQTEKINRIKTRLSNEVIEPKADGIFMFRNIPWYSTRDEVTKTLEISANSKELGNVYRLGYINYSNTYSGSDYIEGKLGCYLSSRSLSVAGYKPSGTYLRFMVPVVDGEIIRDASVAQFYMGYYTFDGDDFGDLSLVYNDLESKLNALYGKGYFNLGDYPTNTIWKDTEGNMIRLQIHTQRKDWLTLAYLSADADERIDALAQAYVEEKTREEDLLRLENTNNVDGL